MLTVEEAKTIAIAWKLGAPVQYKDRTNPTSPWYMTLPAGGTDRIERVAELIMRAATDPDYEYTFRIKPKD